jgi:hypothetical protein
VDGGLLVDGGASATARRAAGWEDWQIPAYTGPLSAFMVDHNRWRGDPSFLADPALANGPFPGSTRGGGCDDRGVHGVRTRTRRRIVAGIARIGHGRRLLHPMLLNSDNQIADMLLKDIGVAATGSAVDGGGCGAPAARTAVHCADRVDRRRLGLEHVSALGTELRSLLQAARFAPWWPILADSLTAGRTGTLAGRLRGTPADGTSRPRPARSSAAPLSRYGHHRRRPRSSSP